MVTQQTKYWRYELMGGIAIALVLSGTACQRQADAPQAQEQAAAVSEPERSLVLENATLNQVDPDGQTLWTLHADRAAYSQDRQTAQLENLHGELFQDGEIFMQVRANRGEIKEDGDRVILQGDILARDPRNGATLYSEEAEWFPEQDLLIVRKNLQGRHPRFEASAKAGHYHTREQRLELRGQVEAIASDPPLQLQAERLQWEIDQEKVSSDRPLQIDRYQGDTITDRVMADRSQLDLASKIVTLERNVDLKSTDPPLQIASNAIIWQPEQRLVTANAPVQIVNTEQEMTLTANRGQVDLETEMARFSGGVRGISQRNQATLFADKLRWEVATQQMEAEGNVIYEQADPPLRALGTTAIGNLQSEDFIVRGGQGDRAVTRIVP